MNNEINIILNSLETAKCYADVFGALPQKEVLDNHRFLRKQFAYLASIVHPDHVEEALKIEAGDIFNKLNIFRQAAEKAIEKGIYDEPLKNLFNSENSSIIRSSLAVYHVSSEIYRQGTFSSLYVGKQNKKEVLIKISSAPCINNLLANEAKLLQKFKSKKSLTKIKKFVPELLDTFVIEKEGCQYRVLVFPYNSKWVSVTDVIEAYPNGLNPKDAAWIFRRIVAQCLAASMAGVVHTSIVPDHILVNPVTHEPLHIGWAHAINNPKKSRERVTQIIDKWKDWYPPEVFDKQLPDRRTDLYMAGKTMIKLLGGDVKKDLIPDSVPREMIHFLLKCVEENPDKRPKHGRQVLDDFTKIITKLWGKEYRPLVIPVKII